MATYKKLIANILPQLKFSTISCSNFISTSNPTTAPTEFIEIIYCCIVREKED